MLLVVSVALLAELFCRLRFNLKASPRTCCNRSGTGITGFRVGILHCPPFAIETAEGGRTDLIIFLWERIASDLGCTCSYHGVGLDGRASAPTADEIDLGLSCASITPERERIVDLSHAFYETHLEIAIRKQSRFVQLRNILTDATVLHWLRIVVLVASAIGAVFYPPWHRLTPKLYRCPSVRGVSSRHSPRSARHHPGAVQLLRVQDAHGAGSWPFARC